MRSYKGDSIENFSLTTRSSRHILLLSRNNSSREEDARTPNEVHFLNKLPSEESHPVTDLLGQNSINLAEKQKKSVLKP